MNEIDEVLRALVAEDPKIVDDPGLLDSHLRRRVHVADAGFVRLLVDGCEAGVARRLHEGAHRGGVDQPELKRMAALLCEVRGQRPDEAQWSVGTWAWACGVTAARPQPVPGSGAIAAESESSLLQLAPMVFLDMVRIPAGPFTMGSDRSADSMASDQELPLHRVELPEFWMARTPVTWRQYRAYVRAAGVIYPRQCIMPHLSDHPVVDVTMGEVDLFCRWASQATQRTIRLPSEAEWEKAARGVDGRLYPWGNEYPDRSRAGFRLDGAAREVPVGEYGLRGRSPYGLDDMVGAVYEFTDSALAPYPYCSDDGREPAARHGHCVIRGGCRLSDPRDIRCAHRTERRCDARWDMLGFRVCMSA